MANGFFGTGSLSGKNSKLEVLWLGVYYMLHVRDGRRKYMCAVEEIFMRNKNFAVLYCNIYWRNGQRREVSKEMICLFKTVQRLTQGQREGGSSVYH